MSSSGGPHYFVVSGLGEVVLDKRGRVGRGALVAVTFLHSDGPMRFGRGMWLVICRALGAAWFAARVQLGLVAMVLVVAFVSACSDAKSESHAAEPSGRRPSAPRTCPSKRSHQVSCWDKFESFVGVDVELSTSGKTVSSSGTLLCNGRVYVMMTPLSAQRLSTLSDANSSAVRVCGTFSGEMATGPERASWFDACGFAVERQQH